MENKEINFENDFLFQKSSFWTGVASILNVQGNFYDFKYSLDPDNRAIKSDWKTVGNDLKESVEKFENQNKGKLYIK